MKKTITFGFIMILALTFILSACGTNNTNSDNGDVGKEKLRVVTNAAYAPMEYLSKGEVVGFDADLIKAVAEEAGYEIELVHTGWDAMFVELEDELADLAVAAITINEKRRQSYDFSVPYYQSINKILVKEGSDVKNGEDLKNNKTVAVQNGTTGQATAESLLGEKSQDIKKFEDNNIAIQELLSGGADAVIADNTILEEYAKNNPDKGLTVITDNSFDSEYYGFAFPKGSELKVEFDKALNSLFDNGKYAEIYKEWFGVEPDIEHLKKQQ